MRRKCRKRREKKAGPEDCHPSIFMN